MITAYFVIDQTRWIGRVADASSPGELRGMPTSEDSKQTAAFDKDPGQEIETNREGMLIIPPSLQRLTHFRGQE